MNVWADFWFKVAPKPHWSPCHQKATTFQSLWTGEFCHWEPAPLMRCKWFPTSRPSLGSCRVAGFPLGRSHSLISLRICSWALLNKVITHCQSISNRAFCFVRLHFRKALPIVSKRLNPISNRQNDLQRPPFLLAKATANTLWWIRIRSFPIFKTSENEVKYLQPSSLMHLISRD